MKIFYDKTVDALDVIFKEGKSAKTLELGKEILLDLDKSGTPISLEILGASKRYRKFEVDTRSMASFAKAYAR